MKRLTGFVPMVVADNNRAGARVMVGLQRLSSSKWQIATGAAPCTLPICCSGGQVGVLQYIRSMGEDEQHSTGVTITIREELTNQQRKLISPVFCRKCMKLTKMRVMAFHFSENTELTSMEFYIWIHWGVVGENLVLDVEGSGNTTNLYITRSSN
jgi:hypothetical protein